MKILYTLLYILLITCSASAQIPNAGFENWTHDTTAGGYDTPDQWATPNPYTTTFATYVCEKGSPGYSGAYYLKLISKPLGGAAAVIPGIAGTGTISPPNFANVAGGFPCATRPANLTGAWQYAPNGLDTAHIIVYLFKWNPSEGAEDTVAFKDTALTGSVTSWAGFSIAINYYSGSIPDSGRILLSASKLPPGSPNGGSYLYIDTLAFAGSVPSGVVTVKKNAAPTVIYPNPSTGLANVFYYSVSGGRLTITVSDLNGKKLKTISENASIGENTIPLNVAGLASGTYVISITDELGGIVGKKLIVQ